VLSGQSTVSSLYEILYCDKGSADGVALGWTFEAAVPGQERELTLGRVVRVDPHASFIRLVRMYQPVQVGDGARLFANSAAASARARRGG
jgi:hypothetical protein